MVLAKKELQQQFAQEHQDLLTNYQKLAMLALSMAEGRQVTVHEVRLDQDYSPLIQAYVTRWVEAHGGLVKRNEKLQMEIDLLKALGEENAALKAENAALIAGMAAFEREHTGLNDLIHGEAPPPPPFPEALVVGHPPGLEQVVNVGPAALVVGAPEPWSALAMSK